MHHRIKQYLWDLLINKFLMSYAIPVSFRMHMLNFLGCKTGGVIHARCRISSTKLEIGTGSYINKDCILDNAMGKILIGANCAIGFRTCIYTTNHDYNNSKRRCGKVRPYSVVINDGCWIGANVIILPGSIINKGVVVAAGSLVRGELKANALYAGVPAKKIKDLPTLM